MPDRQPRVWHINSPDRPADAVAITRQTPWGNPFRIGRDGTRDEVIAKYHQLVERNPALRTKIKRELAGRDLMCYCRPWECHGDVILAIANPSLVPAATPVID